MCTVFIPLAVSTTIIAFLALPCRFLASNMCIPPSPDPMCNLFFNMTPDSIKKNGKLQLYKTEMCHYWEEHGVCRRSDCWFAHGVHELRTIKRHPKYKTKECQAFVKTGKCDYGKRCTFIHPSDLDDVSPGKTTLLSRLGLHNIALPNCFSGQSADTTTNTASSSPAQWPYAPLPYVSTISQPLPRSPMRIERNGSTKSYLASPTLYVPAAAGECISAFNEHSIMLNMAIAVNAARDDKRSPPTSTLTEYAPHQTQWTPSPPITEPKMCHCYDCEPTFNEKHRLASPKCCCSFF